LKKDNKTSSALTLSNYIANKHFFQILTNFHILEFLEYKKSSELKLPTPLIVYQV